MSAWRAAWRWPFGPLPPMRSGIAFGRGPTGCCRSSRAAWNSPSKSACPVRINGTMICSASSKRAKIRSSARPKKRAWPGHSWPAPRPKMKRPPLISSSVSAVLAMMPGLRCSAERTHVPTLIREVAPATAPAIETPSQTPMCGPSFDRQSNSSGVQTVSKPMASERSAISRISVHRAVMRSGPNCARGNTTPISNGRIALSHRATGTASLAARRTTLVARSRRWLVGPRPVVATARHARAEGKSRIRCSGSLHVAIIDRRSN